MNKRCYFFFFFTKFTINEIIKKIINRPKIPIQIQKNGLVVRFSWSEPANIPKTIAMIIEITIKDVTMPFILPFLPVFELKPKSVDKKLLCSYSSFLRGF